MTDRLRQEAWDYGRSLRDQLLTQYREEYGEDVPPPPAKIADQLLTDFLGANLRFDPLPLNIYAQTEWKDDRPVVTVNSFTGQIPGVKDRVHHEVSYTDALSTTFAPPRLSEMSAPRATQD